MAKPTRIKESIISRQSIRLLFFFMFPKIRVRRMSGARSLYRRGCSGSWFPG